MALLYLFANDLTLSDILFECATGYSKHVFEDFALMTNNGTLNTSKDSDRYTVFCMQAAMF